MKKKKITVAVISVISALTLMLGIVPSLAKYVTEHGKQSEVVSDNFYFTSDYLSESAPPEYPPEYKIYGDSVDFNIRNYMDSLRFNGVDIEYTVTATEGTLTKDGAPTSGDTLTLTGGRMARDTIRLTCGERDAQKEITVTVESSSPYVKKLQAKFIFAEPVLRYEIIDKADSYHAELYIHTGNMQEVITVKWNKDYLWVDETNDYVMGHLHENKNSATVTVPPHTTAKIVFFKNDITQNYSRDVTEFTGTINMPTAAAGS